MYMYICVYVLPSICVHMIHPHIYGISLSHSLSPCISIYICMYRRFPMNSYICKGMLSF